MLFESSWKVIVVMMQLHGEKGLEIEGVDEAFLVEISGYSGKYLDKALDDHILF